MTKKKKDKQRSTKHTHTTKDRVTRTPLKTGGELMCSFIFVAVFYQFVAILILAALTSKLLQKLRNINR